MEKSFWLNKWDEMKIGFHQSEINPYLTEFLPRLELTHDSVVFVPLCGKTLDMIELAKHCHVIGVEFSEKAVLQFFEENNLKYEVASEEKHRVYTAGNIQIYEGDLFSMPKMVLDKITHVFDRASMVALPAKTRKQYIALMNTISFEKYLLVTFEYDQSLYDGPPFSVPTEEVETGFGQYSIEFLKQREEGTFKGIKTSVIEKVRLLRPR